MLKILIVGSSYSIKKVFSKKYENEKISYVNFREITKINFREFYDIIILSGFDRKILYISMSKLDNYIIDYYKMMKELSRNTNNLILISTFIPSIKTYSRTVYFYYELYGKITKLKNVEVLSFKKILDKSKLGNYKRKILELLNFNFTNPSEIISNMDKFRLLKVIKPKFTLINVPRTIFFERITRLLDKS